MNARECVREQEVVEMVACGRWAAGCSEEFRLHVLQCPTCTDLVEVASALQSDREVAWLEARVPPPGLVWWRAELRARQDAVRTVSRPITLAQAFGGACTVGVCFALLGQIWPWIMKLLSSLDTSHFSFLQWGIVIAVGLAFFVAAPLAVYFAWSDE